MIRNADARRAKRAAVEIVAELEREASRDGDDDLGRTKKFTSALATIIERMRDGAILGGIADELSGVTSDDIPDVLMERACGRGLLLALEAVRKDSARAHHAAEQRRQILKARGAL